jgi:preprotein translocase subunit SecF
MIGTISSIYVASPLALWLGISRATMAARKKPEEEAEGSP